MSKAKVWTLPALLDRIWMLSRGKRTAVSTGELKDEYNPYARPGSIPRKSIVTTLKRVVTGWDEDYKPRTYELNKISAASAAALYERIKTMRARATSREYENGFIDGQVKGYGKGWDDRGKAISLRKEMEAYGSPPPDLVPQLQESDWSHPDHFSKPSAWEPPT